MGGLFGGYFEEISGVNLLKFFVFLVKMGREVHIKSFNKEHFSRGK